MNVNGMCFTPQDPDTRRRFDATAHGDRQRGCAVHTGPAMTAGHFRT